MRGSKNMRLFLNARHKKQDEPTLPTYNKESAPASTTGREQRLRGFRAVPNWVRNEFIAFLGEFVGTFMFLFIAFSATSVANASAPPSDTENNSITQVPNTSVLLYIALAFGFSLAINVWAFFRISGGLFNPAVTLGLYLIGAVGPVRAINTFIAQILGGIASAGVVYGLYPQTLSVSTTLGASTSTAQGLFIEMFLTAELVFVIFMLAAEKHKATFLAPVGIGLALFVAELCGVYFTGGSLNPARSFGPAVVTGSFPGYHWIYWLGPVLGSLLAFAFYKLMKYSEYETANPGQDFDDQEHELFEPDANAVTGDDVARPNVAAETAGAIVEQVAAGTDLSEIRTGSSGSRGGREKVTPGMGATADHEREAPPMPALYREMTNLDRNDKTAPTAQPGAVPLHTGTADKEIADKRASVNSAEGEPGFVF